MAQKLKNILNELSDSSGLIQEDFQQCLQQKLQNRINAKKQNKFAWLQSFKAKFLLTGLALTAVVAGVIILSTKHEIAQINIMPAKVFALEALKSKYEQLKSKNVIVHQKRMTQLFKQSEVSEAYYKSYTEVWQDNASFQGKGISHNDSSNDNSTFIHDYNDVIWSYSTTYGVTTFEKIQLMNRTSPTQTIGNARSLTVENFVNAEKFISQYGQTQPIDNPDYFVFKIVTPNNGVMREMNGKYIDAVIDYFYYDKNDYLLNKIEVKYAVAGTEYLMYREDYELEALQRGDELVQKLFTFDIASANGMIPTTRVYDLSLDDQTK